MDIAVQMEALASSSEGIGIFSAKMDSILQSCLALDIYSTGLEVMAPIGILLVMVYWLVELFDTAMNINFSIDGLVKSFIKLVIGCAIVMNIPTILGMLGDIVKGVNEDFAGALNATQLVDNIVKANSQAIGAGTGASADATASGTGIARYCSFATFIFNVLTMVYIYVIGIKRAVKIVTKSVLAPLIVPDIYKNGMRSNGIKFLKGLFADYLQSTVILIIVEMTSLAFAAVYNNNPPLGSTTIPSLSGIIMLYVLGKTLIGSLKSSEDYIREIII